MVDIDSNDLTRRLDYIIVGIEVAKSAIVNAEDEALTELNRAYLDATPDESVLKPPKKRARPKKVKK